MFRILTLILMLMSVKLHAFVGTEKDIAKSISNNFVGGNFKLMDQNRKYFDNTQSKKQYSLVFFGYGTCQSICPTAMADLTFVLNANPKVLNNIQPVFISLEPSKDTPELLKEFAKPFNEHIKMLTSLDEKADDYVKNLSMQYKAYNERINLDDRTKKELGEKNDYVIAHSNFFYLIDNKSGELVHFSPANQKDLKDLLTKYAM